LIIGIISIRKALNLFAAIQKDRDFIGGTKLEGNVVTVPEFSIGNFGRYFRLVFHILNQYM
jgi:hypothetical protein